jgi:hypothetical protein
MKLSLQGYYQRYTQCRLFAARLQFSSTLTHALSMFAPFGTPGTNLSATWHPEPRERGTFNILSTCLTTMILCVWTSVHLNVPNQNGGTRQKFLRKPGWLLLALLAPEIVAWNAWEQRRIAAEIMRISVEVFGPGQSSPPGWIRWVWNALKSYMLSSEVWTGVRKLRPAAHFIMVGASFRS